MLRKFSFVTKQFCTRNFILQQDEISCGKKKFFKQEKILFLYHKKMATEIISVGVVM